MEKNSKEKIRPPQTQDRPGQESKLVPAAETEPKKYDKTGKLAKKVCLISGGDSGIGKAVALLFAQEGSDIAISYLSEDEDAQQTKSEIEAYGRRCLLIKSDISEEKNCEVTIIETLNYFGQLDVLVNNASLYWEVESIEEISPHQLLKTFSTNFFSYFWMTKYAMPHLN